MENRKKSLQKIRTQDSPSSTSQILDILNQADPDYQPINSQAQPLQNQTLSTPFRINRSQRLDDSLISQQLDSSRQNIQQNLESIIKNKDNSPSQSFDTDSENINQNINLHYPQLLPEEFIIELTQIKRTYQPRKRDNSRRQSEQTAEQITKRKIKSEKKMLKKCQSEKIKQTSSQRFIRQEIIQPPNLKNLQDNRIFINQWNSRGFGIYTRLALTNQLQNLENQIMQPDNNTLPPIIIMLQENKSNDITIDNYQFIQDKTKQGLAIGINKPYLIQHLPKLSIPGQILTAKIQLDKQQNKKGKINQPKTSRIQGSTYQRKQLNQNALIILNLYRSPNPTNLRTTSQFIHNLILTIQEIKLTYKNPTIILGGDFNIQHDNPLLQQIRDQQFIQLVIENYTFQRQVDHQFCNNTEEINLIDIQTISHEHRILSDHKFITSYVKLMNPPKLYQNKQFILEQSEKIKLFNQFKGNLKELNQKFYSHTKEIAYQSCIKSKQLLIERIQDIKNQQDRLQKAKKLKSKFIFLKIRKILRQPKFGHIVNNIEDYCKINKIGMQKRILLQNKFSLKQLKKQFNYQPSQEYTFLKRLNNQVDSHIIIHDHYSSLFSQQQQKIKYQNNAQNNWSDQEISFAQKVFPKNTMLGFDKIDAYMIKNSSISLIRSWLDQHYQNPQIINSLARLIPISKTSSDIAPLESIRPIAVQPAITKLIETLIYNRIIKLNIPGLIHPNQRGFIKGRSVSDNVLDVVSSIQKIQQSQRPYNIVTIDIKKAYDSVNQDRLMQQIEDQILDNEIKQQIKFLFSNYYITNRLELQPIPVNQGVPQGSKLSPLLYNFYINNVVREQSNLLDHQQDPLQIIRFYADDIILISHYDNLFQNFNNLQQQFQPLGQIFNLAKSEQIANHINSNTLRIALKQELRYLGFMINFNLDNNSVINQIRQDLQNYQLNPFQKKILSFKEKQKIFQSFIQGKLNYFKTGIAIINHQQLIDIDTIIDQKILQIFEINPEEYRKIFQLSKLQNPPPPRTNIPLNKQQPEFYIPDKNYHNQDIMERFYQQKLQDRSLNSSYLLSKFCPICYCRIPTSVKQHLYSHSVSVPQLLRNLDTDKFQKLKIYKPLTSGYINRQSLLCLITNTNRTNVDLQTQIHKPRNLYYQLICIIILQYQQYLELQNSLILQISKMCFNFKTSCNRNPTYINDQIKIQMAKAQEQIPQPNNRSKFLYQKFLNVNRILIERERILNINFPINQIRRNQNLNNRIEIHNLN